MNRSLARFLVLALAVGSLGLGSSAYATSTTPTIKYVSAVTYPGVTGSTVATGINNGGEIVGEVLPSGAASFGFQLLNGTYSEVLYPGALNSSANGLDDLGEIVGGWQQAVTLNAYGFFLQNGVYSAFFQGMTCSNGPCNTNLEGINSNHDFVGSWQPDTPAEEAFIDLGGVFTALNFGSIVTTSSIAVAINNNSSEIVGNYGDSSGNSHGFVYDVASQTISVSNIPGAAAVSFFGVNNAGTITGRYIDSAGNGHGLALVKGKIVRYNYPGSNFTSLERISDHNLITGRYTDSSGTIHGILLRLTD